MEAGGGRRGGDGGMEMGGGRRGGGNGWTQGGGRSEGRGWRQGVEGVEAGVKEGVEAGGGGRGWREEVSSCVSYFCTLMQMSKNIIFSNDS